jgi:hypothetical protein
MKIGRFIKGIDVPWIQDDVKLRFKYRNGTECIKITTSGSQSDLLIKLLPFINGTWYMLYTLLITHHGNKPGRYQSVEFENRIDISTFINKYKQYFDEDGRHNIWVGSTTTSDLIVLDNHNIFHYYGDVDGVDRLLSEYKVAEIVIPNPHSHHYNGNLSDKENELLSEFEWKYFPLQPGDNP